MSPRLLSNVSALAAAALLGLGTLNACKTRAYNSQQSSTVAPTGSKKACVGLQGNGLRFTSHIGTYVALLESDVEPVVSIGGSSGSLVGAAVMGLLSNPTYAQTDVVFQNKALSKAQKAALVFSSSPDVLNTYLFLPAVQHLDDFFGSIVRFAFTLLYGEELLGENSAQIVSIEATVGQGVLLTDFFSHADFSKVVQMPTYEQRRKEMYRLWVEFADAEVVSLKQLIAAAVKAGDASANANDPDVKQSQEISERLFYMFQQDSASKSNTTEAWRGVLKGANAALSIIPKNLTGKLDEIKLTVPNPRLVWNAYLSRSKSGSFMPMPKGMIVHSTFRKGHYVTKNGGVEFVEGVGLNNLYQGYVADDAPGMELFTQLKGLRERLDRQGKGFMPYIKKSTGEVAYAYPSDQVLLLRSMLGAKPLEMGPFNEIQLSSVGERLLKDGRRGVAHAIAYSAGEPGPFRRLPVSITDVEAADNRFNSTDIIGTLRDTGVNDAKEGIVSFGGWSENVPAGTLAQLDACKDADYLVASAKSDSTVRGGTLPGVGNSFQEGAIRASIRGWDAITHKFRDKFYKLFFQKLPAGEQQVQDHFAALNGNVEFVNLHVKEEWLNDPAQSRSRWIHNNVDFDLPSELADADKAKPINDKISGDRFALMLASYQRARRNFDGVIPNGINSFGKDYSQPSLSLARATSPKMVDDILATIK